MTLVEKIAVALRKLLKTYKSDRS